MRVMAGGAIGIDAGQFMMSVNEFLLGQTVAFGTQLTHGLEQIAAER